MKAYFGKGSLVHAQVLTSASSSQILSTVVLRGAVWERTDECCPIPCYKYIIKSVA